MREKVNKNQFQMTLCRESQFQMLNHQRSENAELALYHNFDVEHSKIAEQEQQKDKKLWHWGNFVADLLARWVASMTELAAVEN